MRRRARAAATFATLVGLATVSTLAAPSAAGRSRQEPTEAHLHHYSIDPDHLTLAFLVGHVGYAKVLGTFRDVEGSFWFSEQTRELRDIRVEAHTASVDTGVEARDRHLRSADFLDCERFPTMVFEAAEAQLDAKGRATLVGNLTLLDKTRPLHLEITWNKSAFTPLAAGDQKPYVLGASARGSFERSAFGMSYGIADALVGDTVELLIELEAHRRESMSRARE